MEDSKTSGGQELGLKWHHVLMVMLVLGGIANLGSAFMQFTGSAYNSSGATAQQVYSVFPGMKPLDMVYGVILIALAVMCFVCMNKLSHFTKGAPELLTKYYLVQAITSAFYGIAGSAATGMNLFTSILPSVAGAVIWALINRTYYEHRSHLFVN